MLQKIEMPAKTLARIGGLCYLLIIVTGLYVEAAVMNKLVVGGDPAATAHNIMASPMFWRSGVLADLITHLCDLPLAMILFVLLRRVSERLALLALLTDLVQTAINGFNDMNLLAPLSLLRDAKYLKALDPAILQTQAYLAIVAHEQVFGVSLMFFACGCLVTGFLIFRSGFFPKMLGVGMQIAGVCYLLNSLALFLSPALQDVLFPAILVPAFFAELSLCLWLVVKGVDAEKWAAYGATPATASTLPAGA